MKYREPAVRAAAAAGLALPVAGWRRLAAGSRAAWLWAGAWTVVILGDAVSSSVMIGAGVSEEGNPVAAALMSAVGVPAAICAVSAYSAVLGAFSLARPWSVCTVAFTWGLRAILLGKGAVVVSNLTLAWFGFDFI